MNLAIAPKFDDRAEIRYDIFSEFLLNAMEIQLTTLDLKKSIVNIQRRLEELKQKDIKLKIITIHLPFGKHDIESIALEEDSFIELFTFAISLFEMSKQFNVSFYLVYHCTTTETCRIFKNSIERIKEIAETLMNLGITLLIENEISNTNGKLKLHSLEMVRQVNMPNVYACFDLCHYTASQNLTKNGLKISKEDLKLVRWVHFSATLDKEGYINQKTTHARKHSDVKSVKDSLAMLEHIGIDLSQVILCTEICEEDYVNRPDMLSELTKLKSFRLNDCVTLRTGTSIAAGKQMLQKNFNPIIWLTDNMETVAHYYEGCILELEIDLKNACPYPYVSSLEELTKLGNTIENYTYGIRKVEIPKNSIWYSFSGAYLKTHLRSIKEIHEDLFVYMDKDEEVGCTDEFYL